ncbi:teashirt homolog 2 [Protopterus annectens]|uniref:teashirt homolog 2 n=1 Tax=Protopterus annectens TaxID=7888 RepID=UPI001CF9CF5A|nr:teashirt homolog 2 [Protopterus annectens]XP_043945966.1 teashirt homolog 2 [Protopterus annectens]
MPRRKQQAPKRAAAYVPEEDLKEGEVKDEEDESNSELKLQDGSYTGTDDEEIIAEQKGCFSYQNSPVSAVSNQDGESESFLSDSSDQLVDFKSTSSKDGQDHEVGGNATFKREVHCSTDKLRNVYANFLPDSYWSGLGASLKLLHSEKKDNDSQNGSSKTEFDWHHDALSKTLQQTLPSQPASKANFFSSVQLYRQNSKMYGPIFTGASRFRCRQCSAAYDTLVELTVHMNETGHYQDDNHKKQTDGRSDCSKSRKRAFQDTDKEDAQKVLKCMFCGDSFDSLQDLSVHMIKTKHYQKVPLKEPVSAISSKIVSATKKRTFEVTRPCSPDSTTGSFTDGGSPHKNSGLHASSNNRYGYQNGASYTWQFEACKSQILKCMECGSSHDTLQQLTSHMMVTGHFLKVTSSASKKGKQLVLDPLAVEKMQSLSEVTVSDIQSIKSSTKASDEMTTSEVKEEEEDKDKEDESTEGEKGLPTIECDPESQKSLDPTLKYQYLREEDLEDASKGGSDILKSLENTVTSAINKAQNGTPSWSAYPSIHAAYQLSDVVKPSLPLGSHVLQVRPTFTNKLRPIAPKKKVLALPLLSNTDAHSVQVNCMPDKKTHSSISEVKRETVSEAFQSTDPSFCKTKVSESPPDMKKSDTFNLQEDENVTESVDKEIPVSKESPSLTNNCSNINVITNLPSEMPSVNPLSALQSVLNNHLGKATEPVNTRPNSSPVSSSVAMLHKIGAGLLEKVSSLPQRPSDVSSQYLFDGNDQPIDLTKSKHIKMLEAPHSQPCTPTPHKYALSDIADMVKVLPKATTPKPSTSSRITPLKLETDVRRFEDVSREISPLHKRKGRQSNWNPQHLLILQAQFASSLFQTSEGKYLLSDLGPQERMQISKFTGLSMTTISHWLANVKYQLRKTGGTKFLKNMDKGHPVFYCSDCASQFRTPPTYISHLESHLGFQMKDMNRLATEQKRVEKEMPGLTTEKLPETGEETTDSKFKCRLCFRTFASKHAVKLHLSKTHSKSPENHSQFVTEMEEE